MIDHLIIITPLEFPMALRPRRLRRNAGAGPGMAGPDGRGGQNLQHLLSLDTWPRILEGSDHVTVDT